MRIGRIELMFGGNNMGLKKRSKLGMHSGFATANWEIRAMHKKWEKQRLMNGIKHGLREGLRFASLGTYIPVEPIKKRKWRRLGDIV